MRNHMLGQEFLTCGATRLDILLTDILSCIQTYAGFVYGKPLRLPYSGLPFLFALGSPFSLISFTAIPPPAALSEMREKAYSSSSMV